MNIRPQYTHRRARNNSHILPIDGLRAVAVLMVLLYHIDINLARGGYIGVDIFFVISGYVITSKLIREMESGEFNYSQFIIWRIGRLFPALLTMIILTLVAAYFVLIPDDLMELGHVTLWILVAGSNIFFWLDSGYFDTAAAFKPLLHTWSLAVEEQFYLAWPALIFFAFTRFRLKGAFLAVASAGTLSLAAAVALSGQYNSAVFFLTPFRVYQFALGASLVFVGMCGRNRFGSPLTFSSLAILVLVAVTAAENELPYVYTAVLPTVAAGLFILSANSEAASRLLASAPALWIGDRSYSIYLAHWPIIVLWKIATDYELSFPEQGVAFAGSIAVGALLHGLVERPFRPRKSHSIRFRSGVLAGVMAGAVVSMLTAAHFWALRGLPERIPEEMRSIANDISKGWAERQAKLRTGKCNFLINTFEVEQFDSTACSSPPLGKKSYLIIGDSFASDAYLVFTAAFPEIYFGQVTIPGCQLMMPIRFRDASSCRELYRIGIEKLAIEQHYDGVVISSNWLDGHYYRIYELIQYFSKANREVILVGQHIRFANKLPSIVAASFNRLSAEQKAQNLVLEHQYKVNEEIRERFAGSTTFVDFMSLQCPSECTIFDDRARLLYLDDSHVSLAGADYLARRLRAVYGKALLGG